MGKKIMRTIPKHMYLEAAQKFHWATHEHFVLWMTGDLKRHRRTETMLPRLVEMGKLIARNYGRKVIYTVPRRKNDNDVEHGLACTEGLVRCYISQPGIVYPEHKFRRKGNLVVPEWGIKNDIGNMLLFEYCTYSNFKHGEVKSKVTRYTNRLSRIEKQFKSKSFVLFVIDIDRYEVLKWVDENKPVGDSSVFPDYDPFFFTDYDTFLKSEIGGQLYDSIYINGDDGYAYPLRRREKRLMRKQGGRKPMKLEKKKKRKEKGLRHRPRNNNKKLSL